MNLQYYAFLGNDANASVLGGMNYWYTGNVIKQEFILKPGDKMTLESDGRGGQDNAETDHHRVIVDRSVTAEDASRGIHQSVHNVQHNHDGHKDNESGIVVFVSSPKKAPPPPPPFTGGGRTITPRDGTSALGMDGVPPAPAVFKPADPKPSVPPPLPAHLQGGRSIAPTDGRVVRASAGPTVLNTMVSVFLDHLLPSDGVITTPLSIDGTELGSAYRQEIPVDITHEETIEVLERISAYKQAHGWKAMGTSHFIRNGDELNKGQWVEGKNLVPTVAIGRVWMAVDLRYATQFMAALDELYQKAHAEGVHLFYKVPWNPREYFRSDATLLAFDTQDEDWVHAQLVELSQQHPEFFREAPTPVMTSRILDNQGQAMRGFSFAIDPFGFDSYGGYLTGVMEIAIDEVNKVIRAKGSVTRDEAIQIIGTYMESHGYDFAYPGFVQYTPLLGSRAVEPAKAFPHFFQYTRPEPQNWYPVITP
ncbi:hypothetical protein K1X76_05500 [bacterium]|nr:hypothetical protein [bacterium]